MIKFLDLSEDNGLLRQLVTGEVTAIIWHADRQPATVMVSWETWQELMQEADLGRQARLANRRLLRAARSSQGMATMTNETRAENCG